MRLFMIQNINLRKKKQKLLCKLFHQSYFSQSQNTSYSKQIKVYLLELLEFLYLQAIPTLMLILITNFFFIFYYGLFI